MKQQTAVEWLVEKFEELNTPRQWEEIIKKAKEMEKQQIIDAHGLKKDYKFSQIDPKIITGEQYYNETFKS